VRSGVKLGPEKEQIFLMGMIIVHIDGYNVMCHFMYSLCKDQIRVISTSITLTFYPFLSRFWEGKVAKRSLGNLIGI
jgi:hypothetical protein